MTESNLPDGIHERDLPGNSRADERWERLWENWDIEFDGLGDKLVSLGHDWTFTCDARPSTRGLEKILGELDKVISEMDRCAELIPCEEDLEPEQPEYDPCP